MIRFYSIIRFAFPGILATGILWLCVAQSYFKGILLSGNYEESLGYRYFYSLRQIADNDKYVFLPQGQLIDLFHQVLQLILNLLGPPIENVAERIEVFGYITVLFAHLLTGIAVAWACSYIKTFEKKLTVVLLCILPYFFPSIHGYCNLLAPDYMIWVPAIAFASFALLTRSIRVEAKPWSLTDFLTVSGLVAISISIKISLIVFPMAIGGVLLMLRSNPLRSLALGALSLAAGILGWLIILTINFHGDVSNITKYFYDQKIFLQSVGTYQPFWNWWGDSIQMAPWPIRVCALLPFILLLLLAIGLLKKRKVRTAISAGLMLGATGSLYVLYSRDNPITWNEGTYYLMFAVTTSLFALSSNASEVKDKTLIWIFNAALIVQIGIGHYYYSNHFLSYLSIVSKAQKATADAISNADDRIAFLVPDNSFRPLTLDSAVMKGGANILEGGEFGASPLVRRLFPQRDYFTGPKSRFEENPADLSGYRYMIFVIRKSAVKLMSGQLWFSGPEGETLQIDSQLADEHRKYMAEHYSAQLGNWKLLQQIDFGSQVLLVWEPASELNLENSHSVRHLVAKRLEPTLILVKWPRRLLKGQCEIQMSTNKSEFVTIGYTPAFSGVYSIGGVSPDLSYAFRLRSKDDDNTNTWTHPVEVAPYSK